MDAWALRDADIMAAADVGVVTVRRLRRGEFDTLRLADVVAVAHALGVAPGELVPGFDKRPPRAGILGPLD